MEKLRWPERLPRASKATFHYAWPGRFLGTAYIPQTRKLPTVLDLARVALSVVQRLRVMEGSRQKLC